MPWGPLFGGYGIHRNTGYTLTPARKQRVGITDCLSWKQSPGRKWQAGNSRLASDSYALVL